MKLKDFAGDLVAPNRFIKASFGGFAGSGKTRTAIELIIGIYELFPELQKKPLMFIDNEKGSRFVIKLFKERLPKVQVLAKETTQLSDIQRAFEFLKNGEIGFLFIDSLTKVWYKYVAQYLEKQKKNSMTLQDWGRILPSWQKEFADKFVELEGNCIFTGRGGNTYDLEEVEGSKKKQFVKSGVKMKMAGETPFEPDLNIWMEQEQELDDDGHVKAVTRNAFVMKDRSSLIDGMTFKNPTFKDFKPVVDYLLDVETGKPVKESSSTNLAPDPDTATDSKQVEIELEHIGNIWTKQGFTTSQADKALKLKITELIFGTGSGTEIKTMRSGKLMEKKRLLELFFDGYKTVQDKDGYMAEFKKEHIDAPNPELFDEKKEG
jgi:hypothetical protein